MYFESIKPIALRCIKKSLREAGWAPALVFAVHAIAAMVFDIYSHMPRFDIPMHFTGGAAMAYFLHRLFINASLMDIIAPYHALTHRILVLTGTITVAVFWEFAEFILDETMGTVTQAGLGDTLGDLLFGILGAGLFLLSSLLLNRYPDFLLGRVAPRMQDTNDAVPGE